MGFTFDDTDRSGVANPLAKMERLIAGNPHNTGRIFPFIGYAEVANSPTHAHHRFVINFEDFPLERADVGVLWAEAGEQQRREWLHEGVVPLDYSDPVAADWPDLLAIVEAKIRGRRASHSTAPWWQFERPRVELTAAIAPFDRVLVAGSQASAHHALAFLRKGMIYSSNLSVISLESFAAFAVLQSCAHEAWARFFMSTMKDDLAYTPTSCFEPFPFPGRFEADIALEAAGAAYHRFRADLMVARNKGLTKTYNLFHDRLVRDDDIRTLRELHAEMDRAVLRAYGWDDLAEQAEAVFLNDSNEDEFAYQGRLFWPSEFRDEVLARLLALNGERHAAEVRAGLAPAAGLALPEDAEAFAEDDAL
jgi:hypothetical protein